MKKILFFIAGIVFMLVFSNIAFACTGFTASEDEEVIVGINEDSFNTRRYVEIFPPEEGKFGIIYFCYEIAFRQQAMNNHRDKGLALLKAPPIRSWAPASNRWVCAGMLNGQSLSPMSGLLS